MSIEWTNNLALNIPKIDQQHKELIRIINDLVQAMNSGQVNQKLESTVSSLEKYTITHFSEEESLMEQARYPQLPAHKTMHATFCRNLDEIKAALKASGPSASLAIKTQRYLGTWLVEHIGKVDREYGVFLNSKQKAA